MPLVESLSSDRRWRVFRSAVALAAFLAALPSPAGAARLELSFAVSERMLVEACGGFVDTCREGVVEGFLELHLDPESGTAALPAGELRFAEDGGEPFPLEIPFADLLGTLDGPAVRFSTATDSLQSVEWAMTLTAKGLVLQGIFDEGCCDRFVFAFRNVSFTEVEEGGEPSTVLLLTEKRFAVEARWTDFAGQEGQGRAIELNADSGTFWFFDADNTEIVVKVLDACEVFDRFWFFAAGLTNVGVELVVTDLASSRERRYVNPVGRSFEPVLDTDAFATCESPVAP